MRQLAHRLVLTENCNASCDHCFNADARNKGIMDADILLEFIRKNSVHLKNTTLKIMGGEPTLHPRIIEVITESSKHYGEVQLFTNGTMLHKIAKDPGVIRDHFNNILLYVINGYVFDPVKFLEYKEFVEIVSLHFVITTHGYKETIKKMIDYIKFRPQVKYVISPDTQVDVFNKQELEEYRKIYMEFIKKVTPILKSEGIHWSTDHNFPLCFFTQEMLDELNLIGLERFHFEVTSCSCLSIGLIDWNFDLYYCNQTRIKLGSILDENGEPKSLPELVNLITPKYGFKTECIRNLREECKNCKSLNMCRVGCYYNTLVKHSNLKGGVMG